jgi:hypothetical protein
MATAFSGYRTASGLSPEWIHVPKGGRSRIDYFVPIMIINFSTQAFYRFSISPIAPDA